MNAEIVGSFLYLIVASIVLNYYHVHDFQLAFSVILSLGAAFFMGIIGWHMWRGWPPSHLK